MIIGIDAGNHEVKIAGPHGVDRFISILGEYRVRKQRQTHGKDDMEFELDGKKGFAGTLALHESEFKRSMMGVTKAHEDVRIRILLALHRYTDETDFEIVVGQPIDSHTPEEKAKIKQLLSGLREFTVNGVTKTIYINRVEVAAEGASAFWCQPQRGLVRIIDVGSGTVNGATLLDGRYIDRDTFTLTFGMNTNKSSDTESMANAIITEASKKWGRNDTVRIVGGAAHQIAPYLTRHFERANVFTPIIGDRIIEPVFANAIGFYEIARRVYA
jgi:plasmid segregation protein ParM